MAELDPPALPLTPAPAPEAMPELHGFIRLLLEKGWLIVFCVVVAIVAAMAYVEWAPRVYQATTVVQVEQADAKIVKAEQVVSEDMRGLETLNTVAQKLSNPALAEEVLEANHLLPPEGGANLSQSRAREEIIARFAGDIKTALRRNTRLIDVTVRRRDPQLAARLANGLVEQYLAEDARTQLSATGGANAFLQQEAERLKKKLEGSEQVLEDYRKEVGSISLQESQDIITPQLQDLSKRVTESKAALIQAQGAYQDSLQLSDKVENLLAIPEVARDPDVALISADVVKQESAFVLIRQRYREKHPKYILAAASLDGLKEELARTALQVRARIQENLRFACQKAATAEQGLEKELHDTEASALQLSDRAVRFNVLAREVESDKAMFDSVINRLGETTLAAQIAPERLRVIERARTPTRPASPRPPLIFALALGLGLLGGFSGSFLLSSMDTSYRTVADVEHHLALPVLGTIRKLPRARGAKNILVAVEDGNAAAVEVFRTLRTTLTMLGREKNRRTYLFTSSLLSEGKTFTAINFAVSLAQQGLRTLLMDLDLRRPMIEETLTGQKNARPGVTDYFLGRKPFHELCLAYQQVPNLFWMSSGHAAPNPGELLARADFQQLLNEALEHYDRIVIDTAPLLPISDTLLLASKAQTVVLVVQGCKTSRKGVERSVQLLNQANARIGGIVLNLLPNRLFSGYYFSYYDNDAYEDDGNHRSPRAKGNAAVTRE